MEKISFTSCSRPRAQSPELERTKRSCWNRYQRRHRQTGTVHFCRLVAYHGELFCIDISFLFFSLDMEDEVWQPNEFLCEFASEAFQLLDVFIQQHVCGRYTDMLSNAVASSEVEQSLAVMATYIQSLQLSTDRVRARVRVREPYDTSLARLQ